MMNYTWGAELAEEQRRQEMVDYAEQVRNYPLNQNDRRVMSVSSRWLYAFGEQLVSWGCRLQARYRQVIPQQGAAHRCDSLGSHSTLPRHI